MISVNNLTIKYGSKIVLNNLNVIFENHLTHGLVGLNGSGKTTFLNGLYGLLNIASGTILYNDSPLSKKDISYLQAENFFYDSITGRDYLDLFMYYNKGYDYRTLANLFDIPLDELVDTYSTGMRKKLAIIASLIPDKDILILDEPFNGLDIEALFFLTEIIKNLKQQGKTVIVTSYIMDTLTPICNEIHYLHNGVIENTYQKDKFDSLKLLFKENLAKKYEEKMNPSVNCHP